MFALLHKRLGRKEEGFTLIELMVVVLIIAILIAIAVPTFLGARERAQDRAAQSNLRNALVAAKTFYTDGETYAAAAADLEAIEPNLDFDAMANASTDVIGFTGTSSNIVMALQSESGTWYCVAEDETSGTSFDTGAAAGDVDAIGDCVGSSW
jgi:type IV pilus assembly protein PilA